MMIGYVYDAIYVYAGGHIRPSVNDAHSVSKRIHICPSVYDAVGKQV
jgi:hypothetical protein